MQSDDQPIGQGLSSLHELIVLFRKLRLGTHKHECLCYQSSRKLSCMLRAATPLVYE